jgi:hypothetical protein
MVSPIFLGVHSIFPWFSHVFTIFPRLFPWFWAFPGAPVSSFQYLSGHRAERLRPRCHGTRASHLTTPWPWQVLAPRRSRNGHGDRTPGPQDSGDSVAEKKWLNELWFMAPYLPMKNGGSFHGYVTNNQRVYLSAM